MIGVANKRDGRHMSRLVVISRQRAHATVISSGEYLVLSLLRAPGRRSWLLERRDDEARIGALGPVFDPGNVASAASPALARCVEELLPRAGLLVRADFGLPTVECTFARQGRAIGLTHFQLTRSPMIWWS